MNCQEDNTELDDVEEAESLSVDLTICTYKAREFIDELEKLCEKHADNNNYYLKFY